MGAHHLSGPVGGAPVRHDHEIGPVRAVLHEAREEPREGRLLVEGADPDAEAPGGLRLPGDHAFEAASLRASRRRPMSVRQNLPSYLIRPYAS